MVCFQPRPLASRGNNPRFQLGRRKDDFVYRKDHDLFYGMYGTVLELASCGISDRLLNLMCPQDVQH